MLNAFLNERESQINDDVLSDIMKHLWDLQFTVKKYFPPVEQGFQLI
jgi:hypothetical protein